MKNGLQLIAVGVLGASSFGTLSCSSSTERDATVRAAWAIQGTWTDACCCRVSCPCLFGSKPTEGYCEGSSLVEIDRGHFGDVRLDGTAVIAAYHVKSWAKIYIRDDATPDQVAALTEILPQAMPFLAKGPIDKIETVPLSVRRSERLVAYSAPEIEVEIELVENADGKPIRLVNVPAKGTPFPQIRDHMQFVSKRLVHESPEEGFEWSGRNGFVSKVDLSSSDLGILK